MENFEHGVLYFDIQIRNELIEEDELSDDPEIAKYAASVDYTELELQGVKVMRETIGSFTDEGHDAADALICRKYVGDAEALRELWEKLEAQLQWNTDCIDLDGQYVVAANFAFYPHKIGDV